MAYYEPRIPKLIPDGKGGFRNETIEEERTRLNKIQEEYDKKQIERIMSKGFTKSQAQYLYALEKKIENAAHTYTPAPIY